MDLRRKPGVGIPGPWLVALGVGKEILVAVLHEAFLLSIIELEPDCDVEGAVEWAMRNDWSVEDCVKYLEA